MHFFHQRQLLVPRFKVIYCAEPDSAAGVGGRHIVLVDGRAGSHSLQSGFDCGQEATGFSPVVDTMVKG